MADGTAGNNAAIETVRLLLNDVTRPYFFEDGDLLLFLELEGGSVKRAAAQAIDTTADSEVLAAKVLRSQDLSTDGAKVADSLRKRAAELRRQASEEEDADAGFFFLDAAGPSHPELTEWPAR